MEKHGEDAKKLAMQRMELLKKDYVVRGFKTTTESISFMKKVTPIMMSMQKANIKEEKNTALLLEILDEKIIKYVVSTFVLKKGDKKNQNIDYEKEFVGDLDKLLSVFMLAFSELMQRMQGKKQKSPAQVTNNLKIESKKR